MCRTAPSGDGHSAGFGGEMRPRRRDPPPILFLFLTKRERAVDGPREKIAFGRAPVQWPSARTGVSRIGAGKNCRPSAGSRRTVLLSRPCAACSVRQSSGWKIAWPLLLNPLAALWSREGRPAAAAAQPLAALPPYAGQPFAASPRYGCRVPLAGRCGVPLAGTAHLSPPKSRRKRRLAPTRVCGRSLFDVSNRGPRRAPRGGERRRSGGSETWPCGPGRTIRSLCRRQWGVG